jgi:hypothetical protein
MKREMEWLKRMVAGELKPILRGEVWEDIPVDWQGYK